ncbi:glycosyltransferase family 87 protein [Hymenobacter qilianensis]|uniref:DUF2029 domain-containing protein n=1 Tax=Hymenobacter qilianensis TaxID=1385715 RepID=A0A7H0GYL7_9BACT|nr:glycosyltransferase family 87 protein [Hymenobacter qilianensis]QNP53383.1 DUF2029 domain-containing protein [Hymenobacter qilianensis]
MPTTTLPSSSTRWQRLVNHPASLPAVYVLLTVAATVVQFLKSSNLPYTNYNNYIIFRNAFYHLLQGQDMYILHLVEQYDLYKYSPTFALLMGPFAVLPNFIGLLGWNALNAAALYWAVQQLPTIDTRARRVVLWLSAIELLTSMQNAQSNGLVAGLIIGAAVALERARPGRAALWLLLSVFVKLFGLVAFVLFWLYPRQRVRFVLWSVGLGIVLALLPLVVVSPAELLAQYQSWVVMLKADHSASFGLSVMGWLETWFGFLPPKTAVVLVGAALFCLPLLRFQQYQHAAFRTGMLAAVLLWVVVFNHKAESPTFVIAVAGVGLWWSLQPSRRWPDLVLLCSVVLFTVLSPTDLFPRFLRKAYVVPYVLKAVPCIFVWARLTVELLTRDFAPQPASASKIPATAAPAASLSV